MTADIDARIEIRNIKAHLGKTVATHSIGRYTTSNIEIHSTTVWKTRDTSDDYIWGRDYWDNAPTNAKVAYWDNSWTNDQVLASVENQNDEFLLYGESILDFFTNSSATTATVTSSDNEIDFSNGDVWVSNSIFYNAKTSFTNVKITVPVAKKVSGSTTTYESPDATFYYSTNGTTWTEITTVEGFDISSTTTFYLKILANEDFTFTFKNGNGETAPLRVKLSVI